MNRRNQARDRKIVEAVQGGATLAEVGREFSLSRERVRQIVRRAGVVGPVAQAEARLPQALAEARALLTDDPANVQLPFSLHEFARKHGVPHAWLVRELGPFGEELRLAVHAARHRGEGMTTCWRCHRLLPWSEMRKQRTKDGIPTRQRVCYDCNAAAAKRSWQVRELVETPRATRRKCRRCGQVKGAKAFYRDRRSPTGLQRWCIECQTEYKKELAW